MKYRLTLRAGEGELKLSAEEWRGAALEGGGEGLLATQIVEDFTPRDYFMAGLDRLMADAREGTRYAWPFSEAVRDSVLERVSRLASPERCGRVGVDYPDLVGRTPLLRLGSLAADCGATVLVKLECMEPNSVKDRAVKSIVEGAMARGELTADSEVVEASSGNLAFALSAILQARLKKKPRVFISKMHGATKIRAVRISGVPVVLTPAAEGTASARRASLEYAAGRENVFHVNQHGNPDNPRAHRLGTGPELYHQCHLLTGTAPAEFVTGLGSGGTGVGVAMFREDIGADFKVIGVEPEEASLLTGGEFQAHHFSGLAPGFVTEIVERNRRLLDGIETVGPEEGFEVCRRMLVEEGFLVGASTGASVAVALRRARLPENRGKVIVTIAHDRGDRYLGVEGLFVPPESATEEDAAAAR